MLILDLMNDISLDSEIEAQVAERLRAEISDGGVFHFFADHSRLAADVDCTSVACAVLGKVGALSAPALHAGIESVLSNTNDDGIIEVYIDPDTDRSGIVDPVVCANALYLISMYERDAEAVATKEFLYRTLARGDCVRGTRYYPSEDTFLCRLARLVCEFPDRYSEFRRLLVERLSQRMGASRYPLELAQRIICASRLSLPLADEVRLLVSLQAPDGSFPPDAYFRYGRRQVFFGSRVLTTAFCLRALDGAEIV